MNDRRPWRVWVLAWLGVWFGFVAVAHGDLESGDSALTMHAARVLWQRGDSGLLRADQGGELLGERRAAELIPELETLGKVGRNGRVYVWFPVGHVWLLAPFAALGERLEAAFPAVERRWREVAAPGADAEHLQYSVTYMFGHPVLTQGVIALLVPSLFGATSVLLLFLLARTLGAGPRDAFLGTFAIALGTQLFAFGRETLSDGPGLCCLLAVLLVTVRAHLGRAATGVLVAGGAAAGAAVLLRYQNALAVAVCAAVIAVACRRTARWRPLLAFVAGGLPFLVLLLAVDYARFGDPFDTGYPKVADWYTEPMWLGLVKLFFAAGRGVMWLSPLLWLAMPLAVRRARVPVLRPVAWLLFALPFLAFAAAKGWQGGECWGARYVTPGVVVLLALVLPQARPWRDWPRLWTGLLVVGVFVNLTALVAPVRGQVQLASQAARAEAAHAGRVLADPGDEVSWRPRFSPLHSNWSYAVRSCVGGFEDANGQPRHGSEHTIEPLFGIVAAEPSQGQAPLRWEDRCGRHLWWRFWADLLAVPGWLLLAPVLLLCVLCGGYGWRRLAAEPAVEPPAEPGSAG
ncbi:MAG: glycosyltransferase family 39 protein [Planctomycetes bacterium]|nr:glycosyltransferase family 39 protein [Planctomycetota bacterium]